MSDLNHLNGAGQRHAETCISSLSSHVYDSTCPRCVKIKHVVALRRKTISNGVTPDEEMSALVLAKRLIEHYRLTKGEYYDRQYEPEITIMATAKTRKPRIRDLDEEIG